MIAKAITTTDNPYDPFTQFDDWNAYDQQKGYYSCAYLARIANTSPDMSENVEQEHINDAVEEIAKYNWLGIYKVVSRKV